VAFGVESAQFDDKDFAPARRRVASVALAVGLHILMLWGLALSISFQFTEREEEKLEPKIVAVAPRLTPPPPDIEKLGPTDTIITTQPRFRPRIPTITRELRPGDPALAIWKYLCNRDMTLSEATRVGCPEFNLGDIDLGLLDPLNRHGDVGALFGPDTATMSLDEVGRKKRWFKPKSPWPGDGARAKGDDLGLPGHNPFDILPKEKSRVWGGP
jgi:hypothetical protein